MKSDIQSRLRPLSIPTTDFSFIHSAKKPMGVLESENNRWQIAQFKRFFPVQNARLAGILLATIAPIHYSSPKDFEADPIVATRTPGHEGKETKEASSAFCVSPASWRHFSTDPQEERQE
jgi:hypothetical protein